MEYLGFIAGFLTTAGFVPQVIKSWRTKSVRDVSFFQPVVLMTGMALWLAYGVYLNDWSIILANAFSISFNLLLLGITLYYR